VREDIRHPSCFLQHLGSRLLLIALLSVGACNGDSTPNTSANDADSTARHDSLLSRNLPEGRFQIPTSITPAPNLWINLPAGYRIKDKSNFPNDRFFIVNEDDPSLADSTAVTPGFMQVYVGVKRQSALDSNSNAERRPVVIGGHPLEWRLWTDKLPDGSSYYQREITSSDFFSSMSPELAKAPLHVHIYVAGADSVRVAELMKAAGTLSIIP
jgi:hypothetical protein